MLEEGGVAETRVEPGRVVFELPGSVTLWGTVRVAEITVKALAAGRAVLSFDQAPGSTSSATVEVH